MDHMTDYNDINPMLRTGDVALLMDVSVNTVRRWSSQGILKAYRIGTRGDRRFPRESIMNFLPKEDEIMKRW